MTAQCALRRALSRFSHKRGNDGLTDAERAAYAESWRKGAGRAPSRDEMDEIRRLTPVTYKARDDDGTPPDDQRDDVHLVPSGEAGHYHGWDCYCVPPWTDADGVRTYHHRDASYWANR